MDIPKIYEKASKGCKMSATLRSKLKHRSKAIQGPVKTPRIVISAPGTKTEPPRPRVKPVTRTRPRPEPRPKVKPKPRPKPKAKDLRQRSRNFAKLLKAALKRA